MMLHPKASHFRIDFWSKFHACSKRLPKPLFSTLWPPKCTKKSPYWIFWAVFGAQSDFQGSPKSPKIAQVAPNIHQKLNNALALWPTWNRLASKITFGAFLGTTLVDFGWFFMDFGIIFQCISEHFCNKICRMQSFFNLFRSQCSMDF